MRFLEKIHLNNYFPDFYITDQIVLFQILKIPDSSTYYDIRDEKQTHFKVFFPVRLRTDFFFFSKLCFYTSEEVKVKFI